MRRIIQKYQEGGVVQPAVNTGLPQGGNAAAAIQSYLGGSSGGVSGPLSYTGSGGEALPDYKSLAAERGRLRKELAATGAPIGFQIQAMNDADAIVRTPAPIRTNTNSTGSDGTTASYISDQETYGAPGGHWGGANPGAIVNVPANITKDNPTGATYADPSAAGDYEGNLIRNDSISEDDFWNTQESGESSGGFFTGGGSDGAGKYGVVGDVGGATRDIASVILDNSLIGRGYSALTGKDLIGKYVQPESKVDYSTTPEVVATAPVGYVPYVAPQSSGGDRDQNRALKEILDSSNLKSNRSVGWDSAVGNTGGKVSHNNIGNNPPAGPLSYLNTGGISVANTGLREEEIRQRQAMQAKIQPEQPNALDQIGSKLAMGAVDKGIGAAASSLAAQGGMMGSLGSALGGTAATAATGGLGAGMMAALGPVGIGLGLGKLFGVFNYGGKVPYPKQKKSPLSGE